MNAVVTNPATPPGKMRVQRFKVRRHDARKMKKFEDMLSALGQLPLSSRVHSINNLDHRADDVTYDSVTGFWYFNVVKRRLGHGPGMYDPNQALTGFSLSFGQSFGEDTAGLYDPATKDLFLQYNHTGVRHTGLATYFSKVVGVEPYYSIVPKLRRDAERKLQAQQVTRRLEVGFDITKMTSADLNSGNSLTQMAALGSGNGAEKIYITMTISARDPRKGLLQTVKSTLLNVLPMAGLVRAKVVGGDQPPVQQVTNSKGISKQIVGSPDFEPIDLIDGLMETERPVVLGADSRMPLSDRYAALLDAQKSLR